MHYWRIEALKAHIRAGALSEDERFRYLLIALVLWAGLAEVTLLIPVATTNAWDWVAGASSVVLLAGALVVLYRINGGPRGTDFLGRFFSIGLVVGIRMAVIVALPVLVALTAYYGIAFGDLADDQPIPSTALDTLPLILLELVYYWRVAVHLRTVAAPADSTASSDAPGSAHKP